MEPYTSNIYSRRVLSGEFQVVNSHLLKDLVDRGLWNETMKNTLIAHQGSVQNIAAVPEDIKAIYKTVWEISQKVCSCCTISMCGLCLHRVSFCLLIFFFFVDKAISVDKPSLLVLLPHRR